MASPIDATTLQRLSAAKEEFDQQQKVISHRLSDARFPLPDDSTDVLREAAHVSRTAVHRIAELGCIIGQDSFSTSDEGYVRHLIDEISEPNEELDAAVSRLNVPIIGQVTRADGFEIWLAEWELALTRFRHAAIGVLVQGRTMELVLVRLLG